jgi:hypothetical protein
MDPTRELLVVVVAALKADSAVAGYVGTRIFDRVPTGENAPASPYLSLGPSDAVSEDVDCKELYRVTFQVDAWSWGSGEAVSSLQVRDIAQAVRAALRGFETPLTNNALADLSHLTTRYLRDPDGVTNHAAVTFQAFVEVP